MGLHKDKNRVCKSIGKGIAYIVFEYLPVNLYLGAINSATVLRAMTPGVVTTSKIIGPVWVGVSRAGDRLETLRLEQSAKACPASDDLWKIDAQCVSEAPDSGLVLVIIAIEFIIAALQIRGVKQEPQFDPLTAMPVGVKVKVKSLAILSRHLHFGGFNEIMVLIPRLFGPLVAASRLLNAPVGVESIPVQLVDDDMRAPARSLPDVINDLAGVFLASVILIRNTTARALWNLTWLQVTTVGRTDDDGQIARDILNIVVPAPIRLTRHILWTVGGSDA